MQLCASKGQHSLSYCFCNPSTAGDSALASCPVLTIFSLLVIFQNNTDNLRVRMGQFNIQVNFNFSNEVLNLLSHVYAYSLSQRLENQNKCNKYNDLQIIPFE